MIEQAFLKFSAENLEQLRARIHDCVGRLDNEKIWMRHGDEDNSIGNLVLHLSGNVRQWIGCGVAGSPDIRDRDSEFAARGGLEKASLLSKLDQSVDPAIETIKTLPTSRLLDPLTIQNYDVTVMEAIYHVVEHFAQHTAQIIFATKLLTGADLGYYRHLSKATS
ncbi:MAG: DUF1572 family protein [Bryobacteraceae bacterium]